MDQARENARVELQADDWRRAGRVTTEVQTMPSGKTLTIYRKPRPR